VGKPDRKTSLGRIRYRREKVQKWILRKLVGRHDWIVLAKDREGWWRFLNAVMYLVVPKNARNFLTI
jgi:hypothetical protein